MHEFMVQLHFSFKSLLKHRLLLITVFLLTTIIPLVLAQMSGETRFENRWLSMLQLQMIIVTPLVPVLVNAVWGGKLRDFELKTILFYLIIPSNYLISKLAAVGAGISMILILIDSIYWFALSNQGPSLLWLVTLLQIILTVSFVVSLTGLCSLIFKRTIYSTIFVFIYLMISIQYVHQPMFAIWFNPDYVSEMILEPNFMLQRYVLVLWIVLMLLISSMLFRKQVVRT
ncbi:hypothetical protein [Paenibacillus sp. JJ-223]|uniref:hypothetical protein n=1 Tax=Paenibacillus sp. JJ-223 TaxID=2905647 RepID=UPI001F438565|nr:hypothetical protein [Paenibacillus sp. JJ-223]CAH1191147.1 hypothetical protein PAECIP111890_00321 [Paenibacillus sp. JJ-223]